MKKVTVDARAFADAMSKVSKVLKKSAIPILEEIAVSVKAGCCTLAATDMDTWLVAEGSPSASNQNKRRPIHHTTC